jgi:hypothetical protein
LKNIIPAIAAGIGAVAVCLIIAVFSILFAPPAKPAPTALPPTTIPSRQYQPEVIPLPSFTPNPARTSTVAPTEKPATAPTLISTLLPPIGKPLPDLIIANIGDPVCASSNVDDVPREYIQFTVIVRNIGKASTHYFGSFDVGIFIVLGQSSYSLEEWADTYGGVIAYPNLTISNLDPNWDRTYKLGIDRNGITKFGIKAVANAGDSPIPESDRTNNTLVKYFSIYCY